MFYFVSEGRSDAREDLNFVHTLFVFSIFFCFLLLVVLIIVLVTRSNGKSMMKQIQNTATTSKKEAAEKSDKNELINGYAVTDEKKKDRNAMA